MPSQTRESSSIATSPPPLAASVGPVHFFGCALRNSHDATGDPIDPPDFDFRLPDHLTGSDAPRVAVYKSWQEPMPAGWQRWVFDQHEMVYDTLHDADIQRGALDDYDVLVFQTQSPSSITNGYGASQVPAPYVGGLADTGVEAVRAFVEGGGRVVAIETAVNFVTDLFDIDVSSATAGMSNTEFYIPGSILRLELEADSEINEGLRDEISAWYWRSSFAFDVNDPRVRVAARYGSGDPLLSGWVLGGEHIAGQPAILEADIGEGSVVLFGFQPNYRAQTVVTWPLLFNSLRK